MSFHHQPLLSRTENRPRLNVNSVLWTPGRQVVRQVLRRSVSLLLRSVCKYEAINMSCCDGWIHMEGRGTRVFSVVRLSGFQLFWRNKFIRHVQTWPWSYASLITTIRTPPPSAPNSMKASVCLCRFFRWWWGKRLLHPEKHRNHLHRPSAGCGSTLQLQHDGAGHQRPPQRHHTGEESNTNREEGETSFQLEANRNRRPKKERNVGHPP